MKEEKSLSIFSKLLEKDGIEVWFRSFKYVWGKQCSGLNQEEEGENCLPTVSGLK